MSRPITRVRSSAPTRTRKIVVPLRRKEPLLRPKEVILSPETRIRYRIGSLIGQGGFGQVFLATRLGPSTSVPKSVCIKFSTNIDGWLREAYFGRLLDKHPRAVRLFDAFPLYRASDEMVYCLVLERAPHGDLSSFLHRDGKAWTEAATRREIAGVLQVLGKLHRGQALHRDLTPMNVFVFERRKLKLGDFGIVRHQSDERGITARTMNTLTAPSDIIAGAAPKWQARDDVFQVGQLIAMLIRGDASSRVRTPDVRRLACSDSLKEIIYRCIGERRKRYETADELIEALRNPPHDLKVGAVKTLDGVHLTFTGILSRPRKEAAAAARRAGATVHRAPSRRTSVVVRGRPNVLQAAGKDAGLKLMEIKRLRAQGHKITLLNESKFWRLAGEPSSRSRKK